MSEEKSKVTNPPPEINYDMWLEAEGVKYAPNSNGKFTILRLPEPGHTYICGNDPIPLNNSELTKGAING